MKNISFDKKLILLFSIIIIGIILAAIFTYRNNQELQTAEQWVGHTREVLLKSGETFSSTQDIVLSSRGYIITGDTNFLSPFKKTNATIDENITELKNLIRDDPSQIERVDTLKKLIEARIAFSIQVIEQRRQNGFVKAREDVLTYKGKQLMDDIRNLTDSIQKEENQLLQIRQQTYLKQRQNFIVALYALFAGIFLLVFFLFFFIRHNLKVRKKAEEQLKEYQHFFNNNHNLCGIANTTGYFVSINTNFSKVLGYSEKEFYEIPFIEFVHPDDVAATLQVYDSLKAGAITINFVNRYRKKDGSYLWLDWNATPNTLTGKLYCVARDITEQKKITAELKKSLKEVSDYKYALDESSIVAITDQKGIIKEVNDNFCKISKYNREQLIGQDHRIINSGYHSKEFFHELWTTIANGKIWRSDIRNKAKDGNIYWVDTTIVPFLNEQGKPYQYLVIRADITERKKVEEQLQESNKELEAFTYSVSHDLRAPLRAVNGYAQMLKEDYGTKLDEEGKRIIETIRYNAGNMGTLIDELLAFSKLGRKEVQRTKINMNELVKGVFIDMDKSFTHKAEIKIGKLHEVEADFGLLRQVMFNFISNALKYSSKKEHPVIEVFSEEKNGEIIFSVKDNGAGFDMRYYDKLFGVFQRLHKQNEFEGVGVGLAIVQRVITKHGGKVWAEGKVNEGAQFNFSLTIN